MLSLRTATSTNAETAKRAAIAATTRIVPRRDTMYQAATTINASVNRLAISTCQRWRADSVT